MDEISFSPIYSHAVTYYCISAGHYYDPVQNKTRLGAALGGGELALWADVNMYSYPDSVSEITKCFMNSTRVDTQQLRDDSCGRGEYWSNFSTGIGASMHELGKLKFFKVP